MIYRIIGKLNIIGVLAVLLCTNSYAASDKKDSVKKKMGEYVTALKMQNREKLYPYLSSNSLVMMKERPYSGFMMLKEANTIEGCGTSYVVTKGDRAVFFFDTEKKICNPYFLHYQQGYWRVDLHTMSKVIRFDTDNSWRFVSGVKHPYMFVVK